jgi:hypothetical protein
MTVHVAGVWELANSTPTSELSLWGFPIRDFDVDEWYMSPVTGANEGVTEVENLWDVIVASPCTVVFVDEHGDTPLVDFTHPEDALYVLGKTGFSPMFACRREGDLSVRIETPTDKGMLWPHQAISIVLYDRLTKG